MSCLKCGKKTAEEQDFCPACIEAMEDYPVKSDVHVQLPSRDNASALKKSPRKKRTISAEEQLVSLRRRNRRLTALLIVVAALLIASGLLLTQSWLAAGDLKIPLFDCFT